MNFPLFLLILSIFLLSIFVASSFSTIFFPTLSDFFTCITFRTDKTHFYVRIRTKTTLLSLGISAIFCHTL